MPKRVHSGVDVQIVHCNLFSFLDTCISAGITLQQLSVVDEITATFTIALRNYKHLHMLVSENHGEISVLRVHGIIQQFYNLQHRKVLICAMGLLLILSLILQRRILMITVQGNEMLPANRILEVAEKTGLHIGAFRSKLRSESIKNQLLQYLPQLKWAGINTKGCVATITVKENTTQETAVGISRNRAIVASRDGVIQTINVLRGRAVCTSGQAVKAGDLLISAYTDCGSVIRDTGADGEIYAETLREFETITPLTTYEKDELTGYVRRYSVRIGKKRINLFKDSGIYDTICDKMYKELCINLPGGFRLPIIFEVEEWRLHDSSCIPTSYPIASDVMRRLGEDYLRQNMIAGYIVSSEVNSKNEKDICRIVGSYRCFEMIGRAQQEEIAIKHGKNS